MIVGQQKPVEDIERSLAPYRKVLVAGCGTCVTVCFAGGEKEVAILASMLRMKDSVAGRNREITEYTMKRQCEWEYLDAAADRIKEAECVLSLGCGVGVQAIAERFPNIIVLPGLNTSFLGLPQEAGVWGERCAACGNCILEYTAGICPFARCAKGLLNGPCGGSVGGKCEVSPDVPCAWQLIIERLTRLRLLDRLEEIVPPRDWRTSLAGGPRRIEREEHKA